MSQVSKINTTVTKLLVSGLLLVGFSLATSAPSFAEGRVKAETIEGSAMGTGTQMGRVIGVTVMIYEYSTMEDRQVLVEAFEKGKNQGLVNALTKMRAVGRIAITGTLGYDLSFIRMIPTATGRKIRFITNRPIRFGEAWFDSRSEDYNLSAGELEINETDRSKSTGTVYPLAQLVINKEAQVEFELNQNPWRLIDIIDWKGTPGVN